ncbi:MAG TPA: hypothetical protein VLJ17_15075 [Xanthobacteraceae bacterium]|nr:hypothetical protein [Xanthobacteraceae bacterium]
MSQIDTYLPAPPPHTIRRVLELVSFGLALAYVLFLADSAILGIG